jgi:hypothetical protein
VIDIPARLCYSPKVYCYTKQESGAILDLTKYVVSGQVQRLINQVSSASVTLRNPYRMFTVSSSAISSNPTNEAAFHPMDPITIYLERIRGFPIRVFTGYLDTTPYYQLYPGTITLQASCTLKRLLYTYFDPSLPYMFAFFNQYGWYSTGSGTIRSSAETGDMINGSKGSLNDSSISRLLWAILYNIGQWQDSNIYIENLPSNLVQKVAKLAQGIQKTEQTAVDAFEAFLKGVIGGSSYGSGGGSGNPSTGSSVPNTLSGNSVGQQVYNYFVQQGLPGVAAAGIVGNWQQESNLNPSESGGYIAQWGGSRLTGLQGLAQQQGKPVTDLGVQLAWTWHELSTGYTSALNGLRSASTPAQAATVFCNIFEEPGDPNCMGAPVWLSKRIQYAQDAYQAYKNATSATASNVNTATGAVTQRGHTAPPAGASLQVRTVIDCLIEAASIISNADYPYAYGGGHPSAGTPSSGHPNENGTGTPVVGYDCSGSVGAVLSAANLIPVGSGINTDSTLIRGLVDNGTIMSGTGSGQPECTLYDNPGKHIFIRLNGKYWGTSDGESGNASQKNGGAGWLNDSHPDTNTFTPYHIPLATLQKQTEFSLPSQPGASGASANSISGGGTSTTAGTAQSTAFANAFVAEIELPSMQDESLAIALGSAGMGLMHDQQLLPLIQQVCEASMRSFQSLPNGDFYAFYPDYFGEFGQHNAYWLIDDIEILSGEINLSDDALATHVFVVGDTTWPTDYAPLNMMMAGTINIQNAFAPTGMLDTSTTEGYQPLVTATEAMDFIKRYGARPLVQNYPMVRSEIFEMFLAYQQFMFAWSNQFKTPFTFTFMPELFPGGKVGFPNHGLQMYISSVTHSWDYAEAGFTTTAELTAPSVLGGGNVTNLPPNMVEAMVEPVRQASTTKPSKKSAASNKTKPSPAKTKAPTTVQQAASILTQTADQIDQAAAGLMNLF